MSHALTLREYNGVQIPQRHDGYINATKMCQAGGKLFADWRRLKWVGEYLDAASKTMGIPIVDLIVSTEGRTGETWIHPRLASRLAQWISPEFAVVVDGWVIDIIEGRLAMPNEISHEGAIARGIAALMESQSQMQLTLSGAIAGVGQKVDDVGCRVDDLGDRVERLEGKNRKNPTQKTRQVLKSVIWNYYGGCCPIHRHIKILESEHIVTKQRNYCIGEVDHWYAPYVNNLDSLWLISSEAHKMLTKHPQLRDSYVSTFKEFQRNVTHFLEGNEGIQPTLF